MTKQSGLCWTVVALLALIMGAARPVVAWAQQAGSESSISPAKAAPPVVMPVKRIEINTAACRLQLLQGRQVLATYPVGLGRPGFRTPVGRYQVIRMVENPAWENPYKPEGVSRIQPGKMNPLGTRWIGFKEDPQGEYGMHGTDRPQSVGKYSSHGCVRMKVPDAEALFRQVVVGTPVSVVYRPYWLSERDGALLLQRMNDAYGQGMPSVKNALADIQAQYPDYLLNASEVQRLLNVRPPFVSGVVGRRIVVEDQVHKGQIDRTVAPEEGKTAPSEPVAPAVQNEDTAQERSGWLRPEPLPEKLNPDVEPVAGQK